MVNKNKYFCRIYEAGSIEIDVSIWNEEHSLLRYILWNFPSIDELKWIKGEIEKELAIKGKTYTGQNTLKIGVDEQNIELYYSFDHENVQIIPTEIVLNFITDSIAFYRLYDSGKKRNIIPESKMEKWVIVPKSFVKEEYWQTHSNDDEV